MLDLDLLQQLQDEAPMSFAKDRGEIASVSLRLSKMGKVYIALVIQTDAGDFENKNWNTSSPAARKLCCNELRRLGFELADWKQDFPDIAESLQGLRVRIKKEKDKIFLHRIKVEDEVE